MAKLRDLRAKKLAKHQSKAGVVVPHRKATESEKMLAMLNKHREHLSSIKSIAKRNEEKATLLPEYEHYIAGVLEANTGEQDPVIAELMVWCLDAKEYDKAMEVATYVIEHDLAMPRRFEHDAVTVVAREMAQAYLEDEAPGAENLATAIVLLEDKDIADKVAAKLYKAYAVSIEKENPKEALIYYSRAKQLDSRSGVGKAITALQKRIQEQAEKDAKQQEKTD